MENQVLSILLDLQKDIKNMDVRLGKIEQDVSGLKQDVSGLKQGQTNLEQGQASLQQGQASLQQGQASLQQGQAALQQDMTEVKQRTTKIEIVLENNISDKLDSLFIGHEVNTKKLSKLDTIEKTVEETKDTVDVMFNVVQKHSGEIKELHLAK